MIKRNLEYEIEEKFLEKSSEITCKQELLKFNELFKDYDLELKNFMNDENQFEFEKKKLIKIKVEIKDDDNKGCFQIFAPLIGEKKTNSNYFEIQKFFLKKIKKGDEMSKIYNYLYKCFFGNRKENDHKSPESFYKDTAPKLRTCLINIIKLTFYYDMKRKGKIFYLLSLFKELLNCEDEKVLNTIFELKNTRLYFLIFITIVLINAENQRYLDAYAFIN